MARLAATTMCGLGMTARAGTSRPVDPSFVAVVDTLVPALLERHRAPGAQIAVVEGQAAWSGAFGLADAALAVSMTNRTPIGVASVSKAVTSLGLFMLAQQGRIDLDAPIGRYLDTWSFPPSNFDAELVTVRRLLSHTAGVGMLSVPCFPADSATPSLVEVLDGAGDRGRVALVRAPGLGWSYSGGGYTLLELLVERVSGTAFADVMRDLVFGPLGMTSTSFRPTPGATPPARGYDERGAPVRPTTCVGSAAAGLTTTAVDMALLLAEYARAARGRSKVLSAELLAAIAEPIARAELEIDGRRLDMGGARMGLGHFIHRKAEGGSILFHSGGNPGVGAYLLMDLDRGNGLFVAVNSDHAGSVLRELLSAWGAWYGRDPPTFF